MELVMMDVLERKSPLRFQNFWHFFFYLASQKHVTIIQRYEPYNNTRKSTQRCARLSCKTVLTVLVRIVQTGQNISHFEIVRYCANCTKYLNWLNRLNFELTEIIVSMYQLKIWKSMNHSMFWQKKMNVLLTNTDASAHKMSSHFKLGKNWEPSHDIQQQKTFTTQYLITTKINLHSLEEA